MLVIRLLANCQFRLQLLTAAAELFVTVISPIWPEPQSLAILNEQAAIAEGFALIRPAANNPVANVPVENGIGFFIIILAVVFENFCPQNSYAKTVSECFTRWHMRGGKSAVPIE